MNSLKSSSPSQFGTDSAQMPLPSAFIMRRAHSLTGLFLVLFLVEHLVTNSQAALWIGDDGKGFVQMVNFIHSLPYLRVIEIALLAFPIIIHLLLGIRYLHEAHYNSVPSDGSRSVLTYSRSNAYTWQRLTAWVLAFGMIAHVIHLRLGKEPQLLSMAQSKQYIAPIHADSGLPLLADRLGVELWTKQQIQAKWNLAEVRLNEYRARNALVHQEDVEYGRLQRELQAAQVLNSIPLAADSVVACAQNIGSVMLLVVRDVFKSLWVRLLYTVFVMSAVYHAFNGFWTGLITWGITPGAYIQKIVLILCYSLMALLGLLGLCAIWLSYGWNLLR